MEKPWPEHPPFRGVSRVLKKNGRLRGKEREGPKGGAGQREKSQTESWEGGVSVWGGSKDKKTRPGMRLGGEKKTRGGKETKKFIKGWKLEGARCGGGAERWNGSTLRKEKKGKAWRGGKRGDKKNPSR